MQKILAIEDSPRSQKFIQAALQPHYWVIIKGDIPSAVEFLKTATADLIILDIHFADADGLEFFSRLSGLMQGKAIPVIFFTAHSEMNLKASAFKMGAIDYITKPCEPEELLVRVEARIRQSQATDKKVIDLGDGIFLDKSQHAVFINRSQALEKIDLTPLEYKILHFFVENPQRIMSRDQIFDQVWGNETHYLDRTVDRHISGLRKKIPFLKNRIKSIYGAGYVYEGTPPLAPQAKVSSL